MRCRKALRKSHDGRRLLRRIAGYSCLNMVVEGGSMTTTSNSDLPRRPLGPTGLNVAPLCIGCAPLADMPETFTYSVSEERALETLRAAFVSPINFLDTAAS